MTGMTLKSLSYVERTNRDRPWSLTRLELGQVNLIVGKNATGKSRTLNVIGNLARAFRGRGEFTLNEGVFDLRFNDSDNTYHYSLNLVEGRVLGEHLSVNGVNKLTRDETVLRIYMQAEGTFINFRPESSEVAAVARKDTFQHPFLNPLHDWAMSVRHYHFGDKLGKQSLAINVQSTAVNVIKNAPKFDDCDENRLVEIYLKGRKEYGDDYDSSVIHDMRSLGYDISEVVIGDPPDVTIESHLPVAGSVQAIGVHETGVPGIVSQFSMSSGMFRALSIISQVNYSQLAKRASCILIDDIGEGLDFERSSRLVEILRAKAINSSFQLVMTTNDQFVMDHIPLDEWSVLQRRGTEVTVRNIHNSRKQFEDFKFAGLSNFTFFEMDILNESGTFDGSGEENGDVCRGPH